MINNPEVAKLATKLIEISAKNTVSFIGDKIRTSKAKKNDKETITELEEIIFDLLNDKQEIQRIAKSYEEELVSQKITETEIEYITKNVIPLIAKFISPDKAQDLEQIKSILSVETLTIMQVLGFNYKKAIGEPLTLLLQKSIESKIPLNPNINKELALNLTKVSQDEEATNRYLKLTGQN